MDSDSFIPQFWRASRIIGLEKLTAKIIETAGIILNESTTSAEPNSISWLGPAKKIYEQISALSFREGFESKILVHILRLAANEGSLTGHIPSIELVGFINELLGKEESEIRFSVNGGATSEILADSEGRSSFLQLGAGASSCRLSFGTITGTWNGVYPFTGPNVVELGGRGKLIKCWTNCPITSFLASSSVRIISENKFELYAFKPNESIPPAGSTTPIEWFALTE